MGGILDKLDEWLRGLLIEGITGNLSGMFDTVNTKVGEIAGEVGQTPLAWNSGVFSMIRNLSETVIVPIAGVILTFVMCYELIQLVTEKNNMHDVDTWMFFKWIFKTFCAVLIVTNTWNIVMGIFDVGQSVVNQSAGVIIGETSIDINSVITDMEAQLEALGTGELFGLWFQSLFVGLTMNALSICIMLVVYGRMIEVYLTASVGPVPLAKPGVGLRGAELLEIPVRPGVPGVLNHGVRGYLLGPGPGDRHGWRPVRGDLGLHGVHSAFMLRVIQNGKSLKVPVRGALKEV